MLNHKLTLLFESSLEREKFLLDLSQFLEWHSDKIEWISLMNFFVFIGNISVDPHWTELLHLEFVSSQDITLYSFKKILALYKYAKQKGLGKLSISHLIYCDGTPFNRCRIMVNYNYAEKIIVWAWGFNNHSPSIHQNEIWYKSFYHTYHTYLDTNEITSFTDIILMLYLSKTKIPKSENLWNRNVNHDYIQNEESKEIKKVIIDLATIIDHDNPPYVI